MSRHSLAVPSYSSSNEARGARGHREASPSHALSSFELVVRIQAQFRCQKDERRHPCCRSSTAKRYPSSLHGPSSRHPTNTGSRSCAPLSILANIFVFDCL
jgi:hypothetical protein